jgi:hypothetical protein
MWIAFRLAVALAGFLLRQFWRARAPRDGELRAGRMHYTHVRRHKGSIQGFAVGVGLDVPISFRFHRESGADRLFKGLGLTTEVQSGDPRFDDEVYVMGDHPALGSLLKRSPQLRDAVRAALADGFHSVTCDGQVLWLHKRVPREPGSVEQELATRLAAALAPLVHERPSRLADAFLWRALIVEGMVWTIAGFGLATVLGLFQSETVHLQSMRLVLPGLGAAAAALAALLFATVVLLRGSSRGHRIIIESAAILLLGLPAVGVQAFADANRALDRSVVIVEVLVSRCDTRVTRTSKGGTRTSYHLLLAGGGREDGIRVPYEIQTNRHLCMAAAPDARATLVMGRGAFGHRWLREVRIGEARWSS